VVGVVVEASSQPCYVALPLATSAEGRPVFFSNNGGDRPTQPRLCLAFSTTVEERLTKTKQKQNVARNEARRHEPNLELWLARNIQVPVE
jgi:hypothetical protein